MKISLCNEVLREMDFAGQCAYAASLGYDGVELAPFTLSDTPHLMAPRVRAELRRVAADCGIQITGFHWLLVVPEGLSVTARSKRVRSKTLDVMRSLVELCADLGGRILVHGSPEQRQIEREENREEECNRARDLFAAVAETAEGANVVYCVEPLAATETNFINTVSEAVTLVKEIGNPALRTMLDTKAAFVTETEPIPDLLDRWLPDGTIAHIHVNDRNLRSPGQGEDRFTPVFLTLKRYGYEGFVSVEPFDYYPDGRAVAARAIGYIQGILEAIA